MTGTSNMRKFLGPAAVLAAIAGLFGGAGVVSAQAPAAGEPQYLVQGGWSRDDAKAFYKQDQGSRMIPLAWAKALTGPDGKPFLADGLARYGYLANPDSDLRLPIGFTASGPQGGEYLGMSCAACHTRNIEVGGATYRVDGGPALSDFNALLVDLRDAVGRVRATPAAFQAFAVAVLGSNPTPDQVSALKAAVDLWYLRQDTLFAHALPKDGWGVGRLDAVSMIFDRLTGLDIGATPDGIIAGNIQPADAPVRYPFIWNASRQDFTQWPGFAPNGDDIFGLVRNLGEVYGVFAEFAPRKDPGDLLKVNFLAANSANFDGLTRLETLIRKIGPPKWPFPVDADAAQRGQAIFGTDPDHKGQCWGCHGVTRGEPRASLEPTWATPLQDTGTDSREYDVLARTAATGVLVGTGLPFDRLKPTESQFTVLKAATIGSIAQKYTPFSVARATGSQAADVAASQLLTRALPPSQKGLLDFSQVKPPAPAQYKYESRVLQGIWATAPYLHNGSVPTLADLLEPAAGRRGDFAVGRAYDIGRVGLAATQTGQPAGMRHTTGCEARNSGDSRCGHEFGTTLTPTQKQDLLEYLKTL